MEKKSGTLLPYLLLLGMLSAAPLLHAAGSATPSQHSDMGQPAPTQAEEALLQELDFAVDAAHKALQAGPQAIPVAGQATLNLPKGYGFIPAHEARNLLNAMGNTPSAQTQGMIVPKGEHDETADWFMVVSYENAGYIKDDDAKNWNADELLSSIRAGTEAGNEERQARGIPAMEVVGWIEKPQYNASARQLVWSIESRDKGQPADMVNGINYNTLALGREGYISMNLVTDVDAVESLKPTAKSLLADLDFNTGKRYSDFNADTDKVAEYGLAALVAGVAAKKLGLLAVLSAFLIKFWKLGAIVLFGGGGFLRKIFWRKGADANL
ncbi:DUF2167 domain-containing protein [Candidatus Thiothrix sp. Deng01]|uniref:DUF2167 domain-containing protein n=1 Tax=Candidatus Thiothrix phosphatis TaxID=3112415 RepID=A0ABU6D038_9GAMM|nr:DUF2167 domain-containing protein [Candidatus Thiothrix sp. Deng01]MEB4591709.1 DUF2167 domain-containing protein [Candidatus Thiothrix sp. Deng01]